MEKKKVIVNIDEKEFDASEPYTIKSTKDKTLINDVLDWLNSAKKDGATHLSWNARCTESYGSCESEDVTIQAIMERDETDGEYNKRIHEETIEKERIKSNQEAREKQQYLKLKAKFEGK